MTSLQHRAREALQAQGFESPGPPLIHVVDAFMREEEGLPAGVRTHRLDYAELLADPPELIDRTEGPLVDPAPKPRRSLRTC